MIKSRLFYAVPLDMLEATLLTGANDRNGVVLMTDESMAGIYCHRRYGVVGNVCVFAVESRALGISNTELSELIADSFFIRVLEKHIPPIFLDLIDCIDITAEEIRKYPDDIW